MIDLYEITRDWQIAHSDNVNARIAPQGLDWIAAGSVLTVEGASWAKLGRGCQLGSNVKIGAHAQIEWCCALGDDVEIGPHVTIEQGCSIRAGARVLDSAHIMRHTVLREGVVVGMYAWIGQESRIGSGSVIASGAWLGTGTSVGTDSTDHIDIGYADGYRKTLCQVRGVAYIGAGCRWFTLAQALDHWERRELPRDDTLCLMEAAKALAHARGWAVEHS